VAFVSAGNFFDGCPGSPSGHDFLFVWVMYEFHDFYDHPKGTLFLMVATKR